MKGVPLEGGPGGVEAVYAIHHDYASTKDLNLVLLFSHYFCCLDGVSAKDLWQQGARVRTGREGAHWIDLYAFSGALRVPFEDLFMVIENCFVIQSTVKFFIVLQRSVIKNLHGEAADFHTTSIFIASCLPILLSLSREMKQ